MELLQTCSFWKCVDYFFISCLVSHSDGTHSLQRIYWWCKAKCIIIYCHEETNFMTKMYEIKEVILKTNSKLNIWLSLYKSSEYPITRTTSIQSRTERHQRCNLVPKCEAKPPWKHRISVGIVCQTTIYMLNMSYWQDTENAHDIIKKKSRIWINEDIYLQCLMER